MSGLFGLVDCNNFYVSCERAFRPDLEGRPVVVLSNNDGNVVARSNESKALGITMGMPYFKAGPPSSRNITSPGSRRTTRSTATSRDESSTPSAGSRSTWSTTR
jgi:hypothetical protein